MTLISKHVIQGHADSAIWMTTLTLGTDTGFITEANAAVITAFQALFDGTGPGTTGIGDRVSLNAGIDTVTSYEINSVTGRKQARVSTPVNIVGEATESTGITAATICVFWIGSLREDRGRVRMYLPPFTFDTVDQGYPGGLTMDHVADGVTAMFLSFGSTPFAIGWDAGPGKGFQPASGAMIPNRYSARRSREVPAVARGGTPAVIFVP